MKTFEEIVDTILKQEGYVTFDQFKYSWDGETLMSYLKESANIYASQFIEAAAEVVISDNQLSSDGNVYKSILSLKDQLK